MNTENPIHEGMTTDDVWKVIEDIIESARLIDPQFGDSLEDAIVNNLGDDTMNTHTLQFKGDDFRLAAADHVTDLAVAVGGHVFPVAPNDRTRIVLAVVEAVNDHPAEMHTITIDTDTLLVVSIER